MKVTISCLSGNSKFLNLLKESCDFSLHIYKCFSKEWWLFSKWQEHLTVWICSIIWIVTLNLDSEYIHPVTQINLSPSTSMNQIVCCGMRKATRVCLYVTLLYYFIFIQLIQFDFGKWFFLFHSSYQSVGDILLLSTVRVVFNLMQRVPHRNYIKFLPVMNLFAYNSWNVYSLLCRDWFLGINSRIV